MSGDGSRVVVFDLGGVLVDWDPRNLYRRLLNDEAQVEEFLATICNQAWNERQDAGRPAGRPVAELSALHPGKAPLIAAYYTRFDEMIAGLIADNLRLADELIARDVSLYALTNWSADTFSVLDNFDLLGRFEGRVLVSGREGIKKPDQAIYRLFERRFSLSPSQLLFIDDSPANVVAARQCGWSSLRYQRGNSIKQQVFAWLDNEQPQPARR